MPNKHFEFTLIELMVLVAIIVILTAIAIPQYQNYVARSQVSEAFSLVSGAKMVISEYHDTNGKFPSGTGDSHLALGLADSASITGQYVLSVSVSDDGAGVDVVTMKSNANGAHFAIADKTLKLIPTVSEGKGHMGLHCEDDEPKIRALVL